MVRERETKRERTTRLGKRKRKNEYERNSNTKAFPFSAFNDKLLEFHLR